MAFSLSRAMSGAGQGMADVSMEGIRDTLLSQREERAREFTRQENVANREHQTGLADKQIEANERMERDIRQPFQKDLQQSGFRHAEGMQQTGFSHAERMQANQLEHAAKMHRESLEVQRAGQGIQARQLAVLEKGAELDREIKQIQVNNAKEVDRLRTIYGQTTDPNAKKQISETISVLTGKDSDKYLPVPLKDELGNVTGYEIFDTKRGEFVASGRSGRPPAGGKPGAENKDRPPLDSFFGGGAPKASPQQPAQSSGGIVSNSMPPAVLDHEFQSDASQLSPQEFVARYKPMEQRLTEQQKVKLYEAEKKNQRVPFVGK